MTDRSNIIRLPRRVVDLPVKTLADIAREHGVEAQVKPDLYEQLRRSSHGPARPSPPSAGRPEARESATFLAEIKADWREFASEVRASPISHALVAIGAVTFWTVLLVAPLLFGWAGK